MKRINFILSLALIFSVYSCSEEILTEPDAVINLNTSSELLSVQEVCGSAQYTLWAGQTINAGTLTVSNDETNLYVTYTLTSGTFGTLHLWVGTDMTLIPKNSQGTPVPGQFPYSFDASTLSTYTFTIPLNDIPFYTKCGDRIYVLAHAEWEGETIWGGDKEGTGTSRWYYYADYTTACCETPPPPPLESLGTAFAKGEYVFTTDKRSNPENLLSLKLTKNRWGWADLLTTSTKEYQLWVGAGLNNTSKGLNVGNVTVEFNGSQATITYNVTGAYRLEEIHIYAGDSQPTTIAPGQYGNSFYFDPMVSTYQETIDVTDPGSNGIWLILHAVVWGPGVTNP